MVNIDWTQAPEWAKFAAMDEDGAWWWYEVEPVRGRTTWINHSRGNAQIAGETRWTETKQARPE